MTKITHYINKTLLNFVEIYFFTHCYTVSILPLYFHVHILCTLCQSFINLVIIYVNYYQIDTAVAYHCIDVAQKLNDLPLFQCFNNFFSYSISQCNYFKPIQSQPCTLFRTYMITCLCMLFSFCLNVNYTFVLFVCIYMIVHLHYSSIYHLKPYACH